MTEKQRWLLKDLENWRDQELGRIGKYGPKKKTPIPPGIRIAMKQRDKLDAVVRIWERDKDKPWQKQKDAIWNRSNEVRRVILFEKTETALKAIRALK